VFTSPQTFALLNVDFLPMAHEVIKLNLSQTAFFVCDVQSRFRGAIYEYDHVIATCGKMLKVAKVLGIPVVASEQNSAKLGKTVEELDLNALGPLHLETFEKTLFSLATSEMKALLSSPQHKHIKSIVLMGIESHICVLQTSLDLLELGYDVHVLADGVSSCHEEEVPLALARMRQAGAQITTSESAAFQLMRDAGMGSFKAFAGLIKVEKDATQKALHALPGLKAPL